MKANVVLLILLLTSWGGGQNLSSRSNNVADHPQLAIQHTIGQEQSLLPTGTCSVATGERSVLDFPTNLSKEEPLGDIARRYKKQSVQKTNHIWEN